MILNVIWNCAFGKKNVYLDKQVLSAFEVFGVYRCNHGRENNFMR